MDKACKHVFHPPAPPDELDKLFHSMVTGFYDPETGTSNTGHVQLSSDAPRTSDVKSWAAWMEIAQDGSSDVRVPPPVPAPPDASHVLLVYDCRDTFQTRYIALPEPHVIAAPGRS
jgi:hypothetical protein